MRRRTANWVTTFGRWLDGYTVPRLVEDLAAAGHPVADKTVYRWVSGSNPPRSDCALSIVRLAGGRLTLEDIYRHREQLGKGQGREHDTTQQR